MTTARYIPIHHDEENSIQRNTTNTFIQSSSCKSLVKHTATWISWTLASAATGAAAGATGAGILTRAHYSNHLALESARATALGGALIGGVLAPCCLFPALREKNPCLIVYMGIVQQLLGAPLGYTILMKSIDLHMTAGQVTADAAVGTAVTTLPLLLMLACAIGMLLQHANNDPNNNAPTFRRY